MIRLALARSRRVSSSLSSSEEELDEEEDVSSSSSSDLDWTMMCFLRSLLLRCFFLLPLFLDDDLLRREGDATTSSVAHASVKFFCKRWMNCSPSVPKSCAGPALRLRVVLLPRLRRLLLRLRRWESDSSEEELLLLPPLLLEGDESSEEDNSDITVACPFFLYLTVLRVDLLLDEEERASAAAADVCRGRLMLRLLRTGAALALRASFSSSRGAADLARLRLRPRLVDRLRLRPRSRLGAASGWSKLNRAGDLGVMRPLTPLTMRLLLR